MDIPAGIQDGQRIRIRGEGHAGYQGAEAGNAFVVVSAILTPTPDMVNQTLMAGPIILLYEIGIVAARLFGRARARPVAEPATGETTA